MNDIYSYINENNIINIELFNAFQFLISCQICSNIMIEPLMCMNCQNSYCKRCICQWNKINDKCPNRCNNPNYQLSKDINGLLSKLKFACKCCNNIFEYNEMKSHYYSSCINGNINKEKIYQQPIIKGIFQKIDNQNVELFKSKNKINSK